MNFFLVEVWRKRARGWSSDTATILMMASQHSNEIYSNANYSKLSHQVAE
jgi:hypothetical protein